MIRTGIVGAGANTTTHHFPKLQAQPGVEIVSVCNRSRTSSERVARQFGIPQVSDRWEELVAATDIHAVVIGTWPYLHSPVTLAALAADKHVLCEASMAKDATEARANRKSFCLGVPARCGLRATNWLAAARRSGAARGRHTTGRGRPVARGGRIHQYHSREGGHHAHNVRRRREIHGVHGGRRPQSGR